MFETLLTDSAFLLSIRWMLGVVFVVAAMHKLSAPASFVATLNAYRLVPTRFAAIAGYALIAAELVTALALVLNTAAGSMAAAGMLAFYTLAISINLLRGRRDIDCGCSGPHLRQTLSVWLVIRNLGFIALAALTVSSGIAHRPLGILDWFTALAAAATFTLIYFSANHIASISARYGR